MAKGDSSIPNPQPLRQDQRQLALCGKERESVIDEVVKDAAGSRRGGSRNRDVFAEPGRSARKRRAIMDAARTVFLRKGYGGTSMDEVAALAEVSKQTVYKHFANKKQLFTAIITGDISATEALTHAMVAALAGSADIEQDLRQFARRHLIDVMQPHLVQLRRIVIAEAGRFPELARTWYASGPERAHASLADQFQALAGRGLLRVEDPLLAAQHFNWLILSIPLNKAMFHGSDTVFTPSELERYADEGVRVFLAAYGPAAQPRTRRRTASANSS